MNISKNFMIAMIGITGALGITSVCLVDKTRKLDRSMDGMSDKIAEGLDIENPDRVISLDMQKAADKEAKAASKACSDATRYLIADLVSKELAKIQTSIEPDIKREIAQQLSILDIKDIKNAVVKEASETIVQNTSQLVLTKAAGVENNTADIIRACKEAGITSAYTIQEIIEASGR